MTDEKDIPDPLEGDERIELRDDSGKLVGIADVGIGNPDDPYRGQLLSEDDERRLDDKGREVVRGLPWGDAKTGLYLAIALGSGPLKAINTPLGGTSFSVPAGIVSGADYRLFVGTFYGRPPTFATKTVGAAIELPSDLGQDEIKRKYLTEWIAHTTVECFDLQGIRWRMSDEKLGPHFVKMATMVCIAAEDAIMAARL